MCGGPTYYWTKRRPSSAGKEPKFLGRSRVYRGDFYVYKYTTSPRLTRERVFPWKNAHLFSRRSRVALFGGGECRISRVSGGGPFSHVLASSFLLSGGYGFLKNGVFWYYEILMGRMWVGGCFFGQFLVRKWSVSGVQKSCRNAFFGIQSRWEILEYFNPV